MNRVPLFFPYILPLIHPNTPHNTHFSPCKFQQKDSIIPKIFTIKQKITLIRVSNEKLHILVGPTLSLYLSFPPNSSLNLSIILQFPHIVQVCLPQRHCAIYKNEIHFIPSGPHPIGVNSVSTLSQKKHEIIVSSGSGTCHQ